jgi:hypothetical protein
MLPSKQMIEAIHVALTREFGFVNNPNYKIKKIKSINKDIAKVTIDGIIRDITFGVATSIEHAREYANKRIRHRLEKETGTFDGEYLLRHIPGGFDAHIEECPSEAQKHARVRDLGLDIESAANDYRAGYGRFELDWVAGAVDSSRASAHETREGVIYWYA